METFVTNADSEGKARGALEVYANFIGVKIAEDSIEVKKLREGAYSVEFETVETKIFAVCCTHFDNPVSIEIIEAETWKAALYKHPNMGEEVELPADIEDAKETAQNECGFEFDVKEL